MTPNPARACKAYPVTVAQSREPSSRRARVRVRSAGTSHRCVELAEGEECVVGRSPSCELRVEDPSVARKHAHLALHRGHLTVRDLGSREGTHVNGERVSMAVLAPSDEVRIGTTTLRVLEGSQDRRHAGAA